MRRYMLGHASFMMLLPYCSVAEVLLSQGVHLTSLAQCSPVPSTLFPVPSWYLHQSCAKVPGCTTRNAARGKLARDVLHHEQCTFMTCQVLPLPCNFHIGLIIQFPGCSQTGFQPNATSVKIILLHLRLVVPKDVCILHVRTLASDNMHGTIPPPLKSMVV